MNNLRFSDEDVKKADKLHQEEIIKQEPNFFPGIDEVIKKLNEKYKLIIVSSSPYKEVTNKLEKLKVIRLFEDIKAGKELGPMSKPRVLTKIIENYKISPGEIIIIGDRTKNYNDAQNAGINKIILVEYGWGYDKVKIPKQKVIVQQPADILEAVKNLENEPRPSQWTTQK